MSALSTGAGKTFTLIAAIAATGWPGTRAVAGQETLRIERHMEIRQTMRLEIEPDTRYCKARLSLGFIQKNTLASVNGTIENDDCGASSGIYRLAVRFRDADGEVRTIEAEEPWSRTDPRAVEIAGEYEIGENADLIRVSARKVECVCAGEAEDDTNETMEQGEDR